MSFATVKNPTPREMRQLEKRRKVYFRQTSGRHYKPGDPRYIAIYDNGGETTDRYTVIFTREVNADRVNRRPGSYFGLGMSGAPFWPQGFCQTFEYRYRVDKPTYKHLGKKIGFTDLPFDCQRAVMRDYIYLYDLVKGE